MMSWLILFHIYMVISGSIFVYGVVVSTKQGILKGGVERSRGGRIFHSFYGIPYAEPPVGELRFENPVPAKSWTGVRDGTILPPPCLRSSMGKIYGQEDCLYLNVYRPKVSNETLLPVMVFTYGGQFMFLDALPDRYGPHYFMDRDVIVITFHYRLGSLGFLSTEDEIIPGNYGLKDGVAVLRWVQNYIDDFGGDKNRVTIFGGSSGAISVSLTLLSPLAKGLFHRVISQSGHPFDMEPPGKAKLNAWKFASMVGCSGDDVQTSEELLKCLKNIPAKKLTSYNTNLFTGGVLIPAFPWGPVIENEKVEGAFLVDEPRKLIQRRSDIPWIMGVNSDEGGMLALMTYLRPDGAAFLSEFDTNYKKLFPVMFRYEDHVKDLEQLDCITEIYVNHYFGGKNISQNIHGFSKMFTSLIYFTGLKETVNLYKGPKYVYYYNHRNKESFDKTYFADTDIEMGVIHGDEIISFYNWSSAITPVTEGVDLVVSEQMLDLWTNFAANGDPNLEDKVIWNPVNSSDINYLHIRNGTLEMKERLLEEEYEFLYSVPVDGYF
ncbi:juvenile hormone esterase-like [Planococcus citri]|uniref:juvenile hormone esterase-like n=1 Tax=Planococcus citri TaxID=170843 RepID=UPI0031F77AA3